MNLPFLSPHHCHISVLNDLLSSTLKRLEEYHLINRKMYNEIPPRVEYSLTSTGKELMPAVQMLIAWALDHFVAITGK